MVQSAVSKYLIAKNDVIHAELSRMTHQIRQDALRRNAYEVPIFEKSTVIRGKSLDQHMMAVLTLRVHNLDVPLPKLTEDGREDRIQELLESIEESVDELKELLGEE